MKIKLIAICIFAYSMLQLSGCSNVQIEVDRQTWTITSSDSAYFIQIIEFERGSNHLKLEARNPNVARSSVCLKDSGQGYIFDGDRRLLQNWDQLLVEVSMKKKYDNGFLRFSFSGNQLIHEKQFFKPDGRPFSSE